MLSVNALPRMRSMSQTQVGAAGSKDRRPSSASAVRNWMTKNGLPAVLSCTSSASGSTRSSALCKASARSAATSRAERRERDLVHAARRARGSPRARARSGCDGPTSLSR